MTTTRQRRGPRRRRVEAVRPQVRDAAHRDPRLPRTAPRGASAGSPATRSRCSPTWPIPTASPSEAERGRRASAAGARPRAGGRSGRGDQAQLSQVARLVGDKLRGRRRARGRRAVRRAGAEGRFPQVRRRPDQERLPGHRRVARSSRCGPTASSSPTSPRPSTSSCATTSGGRRARLPGRALSRRPRRRRRRRRGSFRGDGEAPAAAARLAAQGRESGGAPRRDQPRAERQPAGHRLSDANAELRLVTAARLQMAKSRQQLLSSMVMLGINRIVVTDGIDQRQGGVRHARRATRPSATTRPRCTTARRSATRRPSRPSYGSWFSPVEHAASFEGEQEHVATVGSAVDETSESKAEVKAQACRATSGSTSRATTCRSTRWRRPR